MPRVAVRKTRKPKAIAGYRSAAALRTVSGHGAYKVARPKRIGGRGAYTIDNGPWANRGAALGNVIGSHYGGSVGGAIGSWIGRRALHYPAKLFGSGDYNMLSASEQEFKLAPQVPSFSNQGDCVVISHREYLGDIISSSSANTFKVQTFGLNPSNTETFPWLTNIAQPNFQQYKFLGCTFEFRTFSADALNSTNTALGSVFAAINYDYSDNDLVSRYQIENMDWSMSCKPSESMLIPVECAPKQTSMNGLLYVINGNNIPAGADPKTYMLGKLFVGSTGMQGTNVNLGSLYVTYKVCLYKAMMTAPLSNALTASLVRSGVDASNNHTGTALVASASNCDSIGLTLSGNVITVSKKRLVVGQRFLMLYQVVGASTASLAIPTITMSSGLTGLAAFMDGAGNIYTSPTEGSPQGAVTDVQVINNTYFTVLDNSVDQTITITGGTFPSAAKVFIQIMQICGIPNAQIGFYTG